MSIQEIGKVLESKSLAENLFSLTVHLPQIASNTKIGQFVHVKCGEGNLLRRPISICEFDNETVRIVYQVKGEGTKWLSERKTGDALDVLGPLGNGFDLSKVGARPVFIGGGIGVPPMLACAQESAGRGQVPLAILGFRSHGAVILEEEFAAVCRTLVCTDDGSYAQKGFVSDLLQANISEVSAICACGPKGMLRAVAGIAEQAGLPCFVSLEERMGCGIGACLVCACELKGEDGHKKYGHVCKNGPVFDAKEVVW